MCECGHSRKQHLKGGVCLEPRRMEPGEYDAGWNRYCPCTAFAPAPAAETPA